MSARPSPVRLTRCGGERSGGPIDLLYMDTADIFPIEFPAAVCVCACRWLDERHLITMQIYTRPWCSFT
jgi:hypothetical protein